MESADDHPAGLALALMRDFSAVQDQIDFYVRFYVEVKLPAVGTIVNRKLIDRLSDTDRVRLLKSIAEYAQYRWDPSRFEQVYNGTKRARDFLAHGQGGWGLGWQSKKFCYTITKISWNDQGNGTAQQIELTADAMQQHVRDCDWLKAHVDRIFYEAGTFPMKIITGGKRPEDRVPPRPPDQPVET